MSNLPKIPVTGEIADELQRSLKYVSTPQGREDYRAACLKIKRDFRFYLESTYMPSNTSDKVLNGIFDYTWDEGHSSGHHEVESVYEEIAGLVSMAVEEARK